jgi:hypothetical protein
MHTGIVYVVEQGEALQGRRWAPRAATYDGMLRLGGLHGCSIV